MSENDEDDKVLIWSFEHMGFWGPFHHGYMLRADSAGLYSVEEATSICHNANEHWDRDKNGYPSEVIVNPFNCLALEIMQHVDPVKSRNRPVTLHMLQALAQGCIREHNKDHADTDGQTYVRCTRCGTFVVEGEFAAHAAGCNDSH